MSRHLFARAGIASLVGLLGMSLGCDKAPSGPTSTAAPAVTAVSPNTGLTVRSVSPAAGLIGEPMRVAGAGFLSGATLTLDGVPARVISVTSTVITATTPAHAPGTVDLVVINPDGQRGTLTGGYRFVPVEAFSATASPSLVASGAQLTMTWVAPNGRGCNGGGDWIALYKVGPRRHGGREWAFRPLVRARVRRRLRHIDSQRAASARSVRAKRPRDGHGFGVAVGPASNIERR